MCPFYVSNRSTSNWSLSCAYVFKWVVKLVYLQVSSSSPAPTSSKLPASAPSSSKPSASASNLVNALNNAQLLSVFATMMQQARSGDTLQQQQRIIGNLNAQMSAALLAAKQQPELLTHYQMALNNLAKLVIASVQNFLNRNLKPLTGWGGCPCHDWQHGSVRRQTEMALILGMLSMLVPICNGFFF